MIKGAGSGFRFGMKEHGLTTCLCLHVDPLKELLHPLEDAGGGELWHEEDTLVLLLKVEQVCQAREGQA